MTINHDLQRFESAQRSRDGLRIANQPAPSNKVRITRYRNGKVVEIIEAEPEQARRAIEISVKRERAQQREATKRAGHAPYYGPETTPADSLANVEARSHKGAS